jgi:hypothetical protein
MAETSIVKLGTSAGGFCPTCHKPTYRGQRISISNTGREHHSSCPHGLPLTGSARRDPYERRRGR